MLYPSPLRSGVLVQRYKRFLADIRLDDGALITAHTGNSGSMKGCAEPGSPVRVAWVDNPSRKLPWSWEQIRVGETWVGVRPDLANTLAAEAVGEGLIPALTGYPTLRREVRYGEQGSRIDLLLEDEGAGRRCFVEVKSVSLAEGRVGAFPDAVSARGTKHLQELMFQVTQGDRAALLFVVQRGDVDAVRPADEIDPLYGRTLREAAGRGVEILAYRVAVEATGLTLDVRLPVLL